MSEGCVFVRAQLLGLNRHGALETLIFCLELLWLFELIAVHATTLLGRNCYANLPNSL
jgi:hypothetical protein